MSAIRCAFESVTVKRRSALVPKSCLVGESSMSVADRGADGGSFRRIEHHGVRLFDHRRT
jgi:hypothetical protein